MGKKAEAYICLLAKRADDPRQFMQDAFNQLAVVLQKGNSNIAISGMHHIQNDQLKKALAARTASLRTTSTSHYPHGDGRGSYNGVAIRIHIDGDEDVDAVGPHLSGLDSNLESDIDDTRRLVAG